jgi:acyl-CoA reductase-like NAD-dependent aldehyde dehydrogenase/enoyl-CoA hydratase/carnithine racemase
MTEGTSTSVVTRFPAETDRDYAMLIDGEWVKAGDRETFSCVDPFDNQPWGKVPVATGDDVDRAVRAARRAFDYDGWPQKPAAVRAALLRRLADLIEMHADELARTQIHENGKLIGEMTAGAHALSVHARYVAGLAEAMSGSSLHGVPGYTAFTVREPVGVVAAITPWNSPLHLLCWKLFPALAAGCTIVIKPSEVTPTSTLRLAELCVEAGYPPGVVNVVTGFGQPTGAALAGHPGVDKIAFTGSTAAGKAMLAAAAPRIARVTLELGGKSPNIIFGDADVDNAVHGVMAGIFAATGQTCMAGSRVLVQDSVHDEFVERLAAAANNLVLGDPLDPTVDVGPVACRNQFDRVLNYVDIRRRSSAPSRVSSDSPTKTMPYGWPTTSTSGWQPLCGLPTPRGRIAWSNACVPERFGSTRTESFTMPCRSVASSRVGSDGSWGPMLSTRTPRSNRCSSTKAIGRHSADTKVRPSLFDYGARANLHKDEVDRQMTLSRNDSSATERTPETAERDLVIVDDRGDYAVMTINRPEKRNAMSAAAQRRFREALAETVEKKAIVLTGTGPSFCAGIDLAEVRNAPPPTGRQPSQKLLSWTECQNDLRAHPAVFVAAVNGFALGGGSTLINNCELAVAAESATIGAPEMGFGAWPVQAGPAVIKRVLPKHAAEIIFLAQRVDAATAFRMGLVNEVVPDDQLLERACEIAAHIAGLDSVALDWGKKAYHHLQALDWDDALDYSTYTSFRIGQEQGASSGEGIDRFTAGHRGPGQGA